jgi:uncharacterized protein YfkK (UPF0435 family)
MTEEVTNVENTAQAESAQLTLNDLAALKSIIDVASSRGAFKPNEMMAVGQAYSRLTSFLDTISKQPPQGGK